MDDKKTMTAEEVKEREDLLMEALGYDSDSLAELAAQAARVPGLAAQVEEMQRRAVGAEAERSDLAAKHLAALSERDAVRKERDEAKRLAEDQEALVAAWSEALGLAKTAGYNEAEAIREERATLRERVATLEANEKALRVLHDEAQTSADTAEARVKDGHHAIEALRKAIWTFLPEERAEWTSLNHRSDRHVWGDKVCALVGDEESDCTCGGTEQGRLVEQALAALRDYDKVASQPPPAPAQVGRFTAGDEGPRPDPDWHWCKGECGDLTFDAPGGHEAWHREHTGWAGLPTATTPTPTPPPGLREAVGKLMPWVKALSKSAMEDDAMVSSVYPFAKMTVGDLRALRAAYDATGGEALDKARVVEVLKDCLAAVKPGAESDTVTGWECAILKVALDLGLTLSTPPPGHGDSWPTVDAFAMEMRRLLAKHKPTKGGAENWRKDAPDDLLRRVREEADEVGLGLAARLPASVILARCADVANMAMMVADAYAHQDTPPSGPEGGERKCDTCHGRGLDEIEPGTEVECGRCQGTGEDCLEDDDAPPHTPEVPPLKDECAAPEKRGCLAGDHVWWDDGESCACRATKRPVPDAIQPTAPAVVLERDGVPSCGGCGVHMCPGCASISTVVWRGGGIEVFIDGAVAALVVGGKPDWTQTAVTLARALAEAKREVVEMRKTHEAAQYAAKNESWATAGGDVIAIHSARLEGDTAETAKKAAESMRERAEALVRGMEMNGCTKSNLVEAIRALPLEAP